MFVKNPKYRKGISSNQRLVLLELFRFRFATVEILSEHLGKDKSTVYESLHTLIAQELVRKEYDNSYRALHKPATYSLASKGIRYLRENGSLSTTILRSMYKNKHASPTLVARSIELAKLYLQFNAQYPDMFEILLKSEVANHNGTYRSVPDLYLRRRDERAPAPREYFLEIFEPGTLNWIIIQRIRERHDWYHLHDADFGNGSPIIICICANGNTEIRIHYLFDGGMQSLEIWTTTTERLRSGSTDIWLREWNQVWDEVKEFRSLDEPIKLP